jgi:hypothetical integral membrane protein (TIGR02206 family)
MSPSPFRLFGPDHLAMLVLLALASAAVVRFGGRLSERGRRGVRIALAVMLTAYAVAAYVRVALTPNVRWQDSLPLSLCDWTLVGCVVALLTRKPLAFEIAVYWGLTGALAALITPDLRSGFPSWPYFHFFWGHALLLVAIFWLIGPEGMRPRPRAALRVLGMLMVYAVVAGTFDWLFGWNYGYLRHKPVRASPVDHFGPWPWYIATGLLIALAGFLLIDALWRVRPARAGHDTMP